LRYWGVVVIPLIPSLAKINLNKTGCMASYALNFRTVINIQNITVISPLKSAPDSAWARVEK
jgi:hypothetical protein